MVSGTLLSLFEIRGSIRDQIFFMILLAIIPSIHLVSTFGKELLNLEWHTAFHGSVGSTNRKPIIENEEWPR